MQQTSTLFVSLYKEMHVRVSMKIGEIFQNSVFLRPFRRFLFK